MSIYCLRARSGQVKVFFKLISLAIKSNPEQRALANHTTYRLCDVTEMEKRYQPVTFMTSVYDSPSFDE